MTPTLHDLPIGLKAAGTRDESDSMGRIAVPAERYWGAQTQRSLAHFAIGEQRMPLAVVHALALVKKAAALVHAQAGRMPDWKAQAIARAADEVCSGALDGEFPLSLWQTGSGTQSNMNVNEVLANRANQLLGGTVGAKAPVHPNDDVNMGQSSNDVFPTAMHVAAIEASGPLLDSLNRLCDAFAAKADAWREVVKIGRTHLMDAVPMTVGQEWSGFHAQLEAARRRFVETLDGLRDLALGGTAVGTGLNAPPEFGEQVAELLFKWTGSDYEAAPNKFAALAGLDALVAVMGGLRGIAVVLLKIANDIRWLASGPRCGIGELRLPENEPGSSIMPGKVNPTQCEAMVMVCTQVLGLDAAVAFAGAQGNFQLNVMRPLVIGNVLDAMRLLGDAADGFRRHAIEGAELDRARIAELVDRSLMLVTALSPEIGYDRAAQIAHDAHVRGVTLREAALASGLIDAARYDAAVDARRMTG